MAHLTTRHGAVALTSVSSVGGYSGCFFNASAPVPTAHRRLRCRRAAESERGPG